MPFSMNDADNDTLGGRVSSAREAAGYSTSDLAKQLGVTDKTLANWEADRAAPRANKLVMLAGLLSVSPSWLLSGAGDAPDGDNAITPPDTAKMRENLLELRRQTLKLTEQVDAALASLN